MESKRYPMDSFSTAFSPACPSHQDADDAYADDSAACGSVSACVSGWMSFVWWVLVMGTFQMLLNLADC